MNIKIKLTIFTVLLFGATVVGIFSYKSASKVQSSQKSYHKLAKELALIKSIKLRYGDTKNNKKKLLLITAKYKKKIVSMKEDKGSMEFTMNKLKRIEIETIVKNLLNKGFKVVSFKIKRINPHQANLNFKVLL